MRGEQGGSWRVSTWCRDLSRISCLSCSQRLSTVITRSIMPIIFQVLVNTMDTLKRVLDRFLSESIVNVRLVVEGLQ